MSKNAERSYLASSGAAGRLHTKYKPFSNHDCGLTLSSIGTVMALMPPAGSRVLDLGCGGGWTSIFFAKHGYNVVGQDISPDMIAVADEAKTEQGIGDNLQFVVCDYEYLNYAGEFDCAVFFDCLHHADDEFIALESVYRALKPGGTLITHEPGKGHSQTAASMEAINSFGVNEKDMPPSLIISHAKRIGYDSFRVYPMQHEIHSLLYTGAASKPWSMAGIKRAKRLMKLAFSPSMHAGGIVVLTKPLMGKQF